MSQHIYTYDPANDQLNEIGGAGHVIKNESGTSFAKRENLQFNGLEVTDDATNNATIVTAIETNFVGTWAQWQALTLAERAQYKTVDLTDDFNGDPIDSVPTEGSPHAVSSGGVYDQIGDLDDLETTAKSNLVAAINEAAQSGGGGGGGSTVSVNTTDSELFGKTVTLTDGVTTLTKTISNLGVALFEGVTMIGEITVSCENVSVELEIPYYGKYAVTIEGGFKYDSWLAAGRVAETFESLDAVLEDEPTLRQLFLVHDAVDYLASQTVNTDVEKIFNTDLAAKWINLSDYALDHFEAVSGIKSIMDTADKYFYGEWVITDSTTTPPTWGPKGNVPVMTADDAPYGKASATTIYSNDYPAWKAFDDSTTSAWTSSTDGRLNARLVYKSANPMCIKRFWVIAQYSTGALSDARIKNYAIEGSNDGTTWETIYTGIYTAGAEGEVVDTPNNSTYYLYHSLKVIDNYTTYASGATKLQFYGRELKVSVPTMTSNTVPYGQTYSSAIASGYDAYKAFDGNDTTYWQPNPTTSGSITYVFVDPVCVKKVSWKDYNGIQRTGEFRIKARTTEDEEYITLYEGTATSPVDSVTIENDNYYKYYRFEIVNNVSNIALATLQFYGLDYSEKEFESGSTKKWLYDHGVELVELDSNRTGSVPFIAPTKEDNQIYFPGTSQATSNVIGTSQLMDLTDYSLIRWGDGDKGVVYNIFGYLYISTGTNLSNTNLASQAVSEMGVPHGLDVSSINDDAYISITSGYDTRSYSLTELWLE